MDNVKLDDDRTLLQKIFRSLPRRTRLEQLSSFLLCAKGTERARFFSWEKAARETLSIFEEAMAAESQRKA